MISSSFIVSREKRTKSNRNHRTNQLEVNCQFRIRISWTVVVASSSCPEGHVLVVIVLFLHSRPFPFHLTFLNINSPTVLANPPREKPLNNSPVMAIPTLERDERFVVSPLTPPPARPPTELKKYFTGNVRGFIIIAGTLRSRSCIPCDLLL